MVNICPVCGFRLMYPATDHRICPCCGTEFGYDDAGRSHEELRAIWIENGARWWSPADPTPLGWNPREQLTNLEMLTGQQQASAGVSYAFATYGNNNNTGVPFSSGVVLSQARKRKRMYVHPAILETQLGNITHG
jgi:hypothetical protein